ncbi:AraC family transcriptional regulator [uncultured Barnesiella sp.]|uniref:AraC family transcriptional regulator n=1 Tax=uncultured Barnesiella sp. TaxID=584861 RepID=UPI0026341F8A|nr:AraC family transcriptional regulator [uncultured Barnesiella sp.]
MDILLLDLLRKIPQIGAFAHRQGLSPHDRATIGKGFFFVFVERGTALLTDMRQDYTIKGEDLIVLSPSLAATLHHASPDFTFTCICLVPEYFDSLPGSQLLYSQLAEFIQVDHLPIVSLKPEKSRYLRQTFDLFSSDLRGFKIYTHGIISHLCCLLLLQTADTFCQSNRHMPVYVKRSGEIFRKFRKLLTAHYRQHHDIGFYADELHISTTYLSRIVKQTTGNTVRFLISELLCADARRMLVCTDLDIKEIASQLGFSDQSVFGKFFVKKTGLSPLKFRLRKEL